MGTIVVTPASLNCVIMLLTSFWFRPGSYRYESCNLNETPYCANASSQIFRPRSPSGSTFPCAPLMYMSPKTRVLFLNPCKGLSSSPA